MIKHEAAMPNAALEALAVFIGKWQTVGSHSHLPNTVLHGRTSFEWLEGGAFLIMHSEIDEPGIPSGIAIVGSDGTRGGLVMLYFDERGVSRIYEVSVHERIWTWSREAPEFSQRFTLTIQPDGQMIIGRGELSRSGTWEPDLELTYTRID